MKDMPVPDAMTEADIEQTIVDFVHSARKAIEAGFRRGRDPRRERLPDPAVLLRQGERAYGPLGWLGREPDPVGGDPGRWPFLDS
jgi:NADH:flavin oxidoreductase / NADH oxidase family